MSFNKIATFSNKKSIKALNQPEGWDVINLPKQIKTASANKTVESEDLGGFDIKEAINKHPDHLYVKIFAIKKDEVNDNGDAFSEGELKKAAHTFVGVPLFTNHQNDDIEKARGECVHAWYDFDAGGIYIIGRVDKVAYPKLARGIEEGYVTGCSMGCSVENSCCSICHNYAKTADEYCLEGSSPILMSDFTIKPIKSIRVGDNVIDAYGKKTKVTHVFKRQINEKISVLKSRCIDGELLATKNHPFLISRRGEYRYMPSEYLDDTETLFMPIPKVDKNNYFFEKFGFDYLSHENKKKLVAFLGYYAAEGNRVKRNGEIKAVELTFHEKEEAYVKEIEDICIEIFKKKPSVYRNEANRHIIRVRLWNSPVAKKICSICPGIVHREQSKKFDESIFSLDDEYKVELLRAFIGGDGHCDSREIIQIVSDCPGLASQILYLVLSLNSSPSFNSYDNSGGYNNRDKVFKAFRISISNSQLKKLANQGVKCSKAALKTIKQSKLQNVITEDGLFAKHNCYSIEEVDFEGLVYNIETESHSYVANNVSVHNCNHVRERKNRKFSGEIECKYHDNDDVPDDEPCPVCGSTKSNRKKLSHNNTRIYEHNFGLNFIENSFVVNPACHDCGVKCVLNVPEIQKKVASFRDSINSLVKKASDPDFVEDNIDNLQKLGGVDELNLLKESMNQLESVVQSMLKQKDNVSMEYVSDLVKAMADLQETYDELNEMGYAKLPSAITTGDASQTTPSATQGESAMTTDPEPQAGTAYPQPEVNSIPQTPANIETEDLSGLGNITKPKFSSKKIEDSEGINQKTINKVSMLTDTLNNVIRKIENHGLNQIGVTMAKQNKIADVENQQVITEKQLEKEDTPLHSRTNEAPEGITESSEQLGGSEKSNDTSSDSGQVRKGTYETITEDQLGTVNASLVRFDSVPEVITEKQWEDFTRVVASDVPSDYTETITEDQIKQLLSKHRFVGSYETITEDQLKNMNMTDGLKRWANKDYSLNVVKVATDSLADAIAKYHKSPEELAKVASFIADDANVKNKAAFLSVANSLPQKKDEKEALASRVKYFNKIASNDSQVSAIDSLILSISDNAKFAMKAEDIFDSVAYITKNKIAMAKVNDLVRTKIANTDISKVATKEDAMAKAIKAMDRPDDGRYQIKATLDDIATPITDKKAFLTGVKKYAQSMIDDEDVAAAVIKLQVGDNGELIIDIEDGAFDSEIGVEDLEGVIEGPVEDIEVCEVEEIEEPEDTEDFEEDFEDTTEEDEEDEEDEVEEGEAEEDIEDNLEATASKRDKIVKEAQMMGGEMGGQGGADQGPGAGATMPQMGAQDVPPMENFTEEEGMGEEFEEEDEDLEALPPGSLCPACGSKDMDILSGDMKCNSCGWLGQVKVEIISKNWPNVTPSENDVEEDEDMDEFGEGEGFEMTGEEGEMPAVAAMGKLNKYTLEKLASNDISLGEISPATGSKNTVSLGDGKYACLDTGTKYKVSYATNGKDIYAQWEWKPLVKGVNVKCSSCERAKNQIVKALSSVGISEDKFNGMDIYDKVKAIKKAKSKVGNIKTASKDASVVDDYKVAFGGYGENFPMTSCIEKLARRFGEDAVALSGPCEGKRLAECVCKRLKKADIYTDGLATKVASVWSVASGDEECVTHQVRCGHSLREAASICDTLKTALAEPEDLLADELGEDFEDAPDDFDNGPEDDGPDGFPVDEMEDIDPFEEADSTVTLELPIDVVEQLDKEMDTALGENPEDEEHHEDLDNDGVADVVEEDISEEEVIEDEEPLGEIIVEEAPIEEPFDDEEEIIDDTKPCDGENVVFEEENSENNEGVSDEEGKNNKVKVNVSPNLAENTEYDYKEASNMKSTHGKTGKVNLDLSGVVEALNKSKSINKTADEKTVEQKNVQDSVDNYTEGEDGGKMGHENETIPSAQKPSVPRNNATMGEEDSDLNPDGKPLPEIPSTTETMGHEDEAGLSGGDASFTGGDEGAGKTSTANTEEDLMHMRGYGTSKEGLSRLAERILNAKKLESPEAVSEDKDIKPIKGDSALGKEENFEAEKPENVKGDEDASMMGHEKDTLDSKPDSPEDHPDIHSGDAQMGEEDLDSEKTTKDKGTVIATGSDAESEAYRVAARMLEAKLIEASSLKQKVNELKGYKPAQIKDIEKSIFASKKGLDAVSDGMSQAVIVSEASSETSAKKRNNANLSDVFSGMFTLSQRNEIADSDMDAQLRKLR